MTKYTVFQCWVVFLASLIFHQNAEAGSSKYRNNVLHVFNPTTDPCFKLTTYSDPDVKEAADSACIRAFKDLDQLGVNSCFGWRYARCRQLPNFNHFQCSCMISGCNSDGIKSDQPTSFRYCAWQVYNQEILKGRSGAPSPDFQRVYVDVQNDAVGKTRQSNLAPVEAGHSQRAPDAVGHSQRAPGAAGHSKRATDEAGPSNGSRVKRIRFYSSGAGNAQSGSSSWAVGIPVVADAPYSQGLGLSSANPIQVSSGAEERHECHVCGHSYATRQILRDHKKSHRPGTHCYLCNRNFSNKGNYNHHMRKNHKAIADAEAAQADAKRNAGAQHECELCAARFSTRKSLLEHMAFHRGETMCDQCDRIFSRKTTLNAHKKRDH